MSNLHGKCKISVENAGKIYYTEIRTAGAENMADSDRIVQAGRLQKEKMREEKP